MEILKKQAVDKNWSIANVLSKDTWYCSVLLLLIGLIDQHTKHEKNSDNKIKSQKERFQIVMNSLLDDEKKHMLNHYHGNRYKTLDDVTSHLYGTRNFFLQNCYAGIQYNIHLTFKNIYVLIDFD